MRAKICGITDKPALAAAIKGDAAYIGFVFFGKSPRNIDTTAAAVLSTEVPAGICKVALTVDIGDAALDSILSSVGIDMLQLHGSETPARVSQIKTRTGLPVMKAIGLSGEFDLRAISDYASVADQLLIDAKAPTGATIPGGNGIAFDWRLIAGRRWPVPWMLAGGLTSKNVAEAARLTGARQVDVSSGVECAPGVKSPERITEFLAACRNEVPAL
ncbi:phosphoribosylanthranilate isomerase [Algicella marina]|uniref:phosphoribosylanthranilate isomerase n=1 Tax=Algicella marina TaxID=2683284 RepID=UPI0024DFBB2F|nr:phosphoribosylanthranilate isomerase [Algicella marina]